MCGIFGYVGVKQNATRAVSEGLKRLDYRGYDSWGVAMLQENNILVEKHLGVVDEKLLNLPKSKIAIGHTRWATNGAVTVPNAHPHYESDKSFVVAHNGIVENFVEIKKILETHYEFSSETDTEVIVHQIEEERKQTESLAEAVRLAFKKCTGRNTIILLSNDGEIIAARNGSPLVIGIADNFSEIYLSSDTLSFAPHVSQIIVLDNGQMVTIKNKKINILSIQTGKESEYVIEKNTLTDNAVNKEGYEHFMLKEIYEDPFVINRVAEQKDSDYEILTQAIKQARNVYCIGSGTAGAAAAQMAYYLRVFGNIPAVSLIGAEAQDYFDLIGKDDLLIAPSQSGETADVLEVMERVKKNGTKIASFVNMQGSMMTRLSDYKFMANAGPEICVMSTKIFVSQIAWGYLVAKGVQGKREEGKKNLQDVSKQIDTLLHTQSNIKEIQEMAQVLAGKNDIFLLSKGQNLQVIKEGMVKIIEGSYIHAHAIPAGDLKHYAITLMDTGVPVICVLSNDDNMTDVLTAIGEVKARGVSVIAIAPKTDANFDKTFLVPDVGEVSAILNIVPLQLLAYYMAVALGNSVDKPRNIAKSVTVK